MCLVSLICEVLKQRGVYSQYGLHIMEVYKGLQGSTMVYMIKESPDSYRAIVDDDLDDVLVSLY